jgi:superfamily II DNA or RNA helicase
LNFSTLRLRPYQLAAQQAIVEARKRGARAQLVSLATGLGKTVIIATLPDLLELRPTDITLVVAHRDELIGQLVEKMKAQNPDAVVGIEKADDAASEECSIIVATVQTLTGTRLTRFVTKFGRRIALFVIDEAHHAAAPTYRAILDKIVAKRPDAMVLGFTATPQRGDGVELNEIFPETVYQMDARAAIDEGYLVPVRSYAVSTDVDLDAVGSRAGDFVLGQLADAVDTEERNMAVLDAYQRLTPGKKTLVFTASVEHARNVARLFKGAGIRAEFASGETPHAEREAIVAGFRGDRIDVLVNCGLYLEGFDVPSVQAIINARPTKSTTLYTQITGRGLRPLDEDAFIISNFPTPLARKGFIENTSRKPFATIIDIVDKARRHQLVTLPTLWGLPAQIDALGRPISEVAENYEKLFAKAPREAARVRDAEQIDGALRDFENASKPNKAGVWQMVSPEHWRLERMPERIPRKRNGEVIDNFDKQFNAMMDLYIRNKPRGGMARESPQAYAMRTLDVDRRSLVSDTQLVDVVLRGDVWIATYKNGRGPARDLISAPSLPDAIAAATARIEAGDPFATRRRNGPVAKKRNATKWRQKKKRNAGLSAEAV